MNNKPGSIKKKMIDLLKNPPERTLPEAAEKEFIARLYEVRKEGKSVVRFEPFKIIFSNEGVMASSAFVIAAFIINFLFIPMYPTVSNIEGTVKIFRSSKNEWVFASKKGMRLGKNDVLKTFDNGQADVVIPGLFHMRLKSDSEIKLCKTISRAASGNIEYTLNQGRVLANYNKNRKIGKELNIQTPQAEASALGTDFLVESTPAMNRTMVGVLEGVVNVIPVGAAGAVRDATLVRGGEKTIVFQGMSPSRPERLAEDDFIEMEELYSLGSKGQVVLLISTGPTRTRELLFLRPLYTSSEKTSPFAKRLKIISENIRLAIKENSKEKHQKNIAALEELVKDLPDPKRDVNLLLFIGAYYTYIGEDKKAVDIFERIIEDYPGSSLASIAQCAIGIIYEERLKDPDRAQEAYHKVLSNYPSSPEADEASTALKRLTEQKIY